MIQRYIRGVKKCTSVSRALAKCSEIANVIDVSMGMHEKLCAETTLFEPLNDFGDAVASIDNDGLVRLFIADNRTIALQWPDGKGFNNHSMFKLKSRKLPSK